MRELGDEPSLAHDEDPVGDAQHLGQLGGDHRAPRRPRRASSSSKRCTSAFVPMSMPRVGSSTMSSDGRRPSHLASTTFCWLPPESDVIGLHEATVLDLQARSPIARRSAARARPDEPERDASRRSDASAMLRAIDMSMTRPCWRRSSGTRPTPAPSRSSARPPAAACRSMRHAAGVVAVDPEHGTATSLRPAPTRPRQRDDLARAGPRSRRRRRRPRA